MINEMVLDPEKIQIEFFYTMGYFARDKGKFYLYQFY